MEQPMRQVEKMNVSCLYIYLYDMNVSKFHLACIRGDLETVKTHLKRNHINEVESFVEEKEENEWTLIEHRLLTPLLCAIENNHLNIVKYLVGQGADVHQLRALSVACRCKHLSIVDYLLDVMIVACRLSPKCSGPSSSLSLWYDKAAVQWLEALPIGNGHLGGMVYGGFPREIIQINADTLWAGCPHDYSNDEGLKALPEIRQLVAENQWVEAQTMIDAHFFGKPATQAPYQPVGNLQLDLFGQSMSSIGQYQRELNLEKAIATTSYTDEDGVQYRRDCFASYPDRCIIVRLESSSLQSINCVVSFSSPQRSTISTRSSNELIVDGIGADHQTMPGSVRFRLVINVETDGVCYALNNRLLIFSSSNVTLRIVIATSYIDYSNVNGDEVQLAEQFLSSCLSHPYAELVQRHLIDYQSLFNRVELNVGESAAMLEPTDHRIEQFSSDPSNDPQLVTLYFQYGRYLLITSSRPGSQAATLQGIWNDKMDPPWQSKYTININIEMNYWPAGPANLIECFEPLFDLIHDISQTGQSTARRQYGTTREGSWVCHHNTDLWRGTAPVDYAMYGTWPTGGIWLAKTIWDHFQFTGDQASLRRHYPVLRSAAQFFVETLIESSNYLVTSPSMSPEVAHHAQINAVVCAGPTLDILLLKDLFHNVIQASLLFDIDAPFREEVQKTLDRLPPLQIGHLGQLQEWFDDWDDQADMHSAHMSHLYSVFPGNAISSEPSALRDAALQSMALRGPFDPTAGWSLAWKSNLWARFRNGSNAFRVLSMLFNPGHTAPNLFDLILGPPFQIDANFGATAAVCEMLLQSHENRIDLLPALPIAMWPQGFVRGLRARGDYQVSIWWQDGQLIRAEIIPGSTSTDCRVKYGEKECFLKNIELGYTYHLDASLQFTHQSQNIP